MSSTANSNPGLSFGVSNNPLRRGPFVPSHPNTANKASPQLPQHSSLYQTQAYTAQQASQASFPHHLYSSNPTPPQISNITNVQNGARTPQSQVPSTLPGPRQRGPAPRQLQPQPTGLGYLQQSMNQPSMNQQPMKPQQLNQPPLSQHAINQQSMKQQSMKQQQRVPQPLNQQGGKPQPLNPQALSQQALAHQSLNPTPVTQAMSQQGLNQPVQNNDGTRMPQSPIPHALSKLTLPATQQQKPPGPQVQQRPQHVRQPVPQQVRQNTPQQIQQPPTQHLAHQIQQQSTPPQPEAVEPARDNHDDDEDVHMESQDDSHIMDTCQEPKLIEGSPFVPRRPMGPMMSAPPEGGSYSTLEAVHKHVLEYCTSVGYAIVIGRSKKTVPGLKKVLFVCDRAGKPPHRISPEQRKRKTTSRKCDCQFGFFAIEQRTQWVIRYRPDSQHLRHNHGPSESPLLHPAARKLDTKMVAQVKQLKDSGVGVQQTLEILQSSNPHVPLLPRDIYNARAAINRTPQKPVEIASLAEEDVQPSVTHGKPHASAEDRIRADLRREILKYREENMELKAAHQKEMEELKAKLAEKEAMIRKFEMFIDICNERVMVQRDKLNDEPGANGAGGSSHA